MVTAKERKLLDFVYRQGQELVKYMKENGYGDKYESISLYVSPNRIYDGHKHDFISSSFSEFYDSGEVKRIVSSTTNYITQKPEVTETNYEKEYSGSE